MPDLTISRTPDLNASVKERTHSTTESANSKVQLRAMVRLLWGPVGY
jgi:hypothetical protein